MRCTRCGWPDEERSAELATGSAADVPEVDEVVRLVLLTAGHSPEAGTTPAPPVRRGPAIRECRDVTTCTCGDVRLDYDHVDDAGWAFGRTAVLDQLLSLDPLFRTPTAALWSDQARANLVRERRRWTAAL